MGIYLTGMGLITALGTETNEAGPNPTDQTGTLAKLCEHQSGLGPLTLFSHAEARPVGEIREGLLPPDTTCLPRTAGMALAAAEKALGGHEQNIPDAVIIGVTTGGMPETEGHLKAGSSAPSDYRCHACNSVTEAVAEKAKCRGLLMTVSTACSSGAVAAALGFKLLEQGLAERVLAGGVDALCRLTYHGFNALQLLDPAGARPFDQDRKGMSLSEAAAMLLMEARPEKPRNVIAQIRGCGMSCDAYHSTAPHPEGKGAASAMETAMKDGGLSPADIDYISLHGTGTPDNDAAEAKAVTALFGSHPPPLSSVKGALGHSLAAAGAVELILSAAAIHAGKIPPNHGLKTPDPELPIQPVTEPETRDIHHVLSNSFGFGGNNAALVVSKAPASSEPLKPRPKPSPRPLAVSAGACITGAGMTGATATGFFACRSCQGIHPTADLSQHLPPRAIRRLKRLPRISLAMADEILKTHEARNTLSGVFFGTGWGALSETEAFLSKLFKNEERFSSPMDFIGSVHNAPAGEIAMMFDITGPNITVTGGDYSFEQALTAASILDDASENPFLVLAADEYHKRLSPLFDPSQKSGAEPADGGAAICLKRDQNGPQVLPLFYEAAAGDADAVLPLIERLGGGEAVKARYGAIFAGIPAAFRQTGEMQLRQFTERTGTQAPVIDYRQYTGEFAAASAVAVCLAVQSLREGRIPSPLPGGEASALEKNRILVLGTGHYLTAIEVFET